MLLRIGRRVHPACASLLTAEECECGVAARGLCAPYICAFVPEVRRTSASLMQFDYLFYEEEWSEEAETETERRGPSLTLTSCTFPDVDVLVVSSIALRPLLCSPSYDPLCRALRYLKVDRIT